MSPRTLTFSLALGMLSLGLHAPAFAETAPGAASLLEVEGTTQNVLLSDGARVEKAVTLYQRGEYKKCAIELSALLNGAPPESLTDPTAVEKGRLWLATCLIGDGQPADAETVLEAALRARPGMRTPDPLTFPRALIDLFIQAQDRLRFVLQEDEEKQILAAKGQTDQALARAALEQRRIEKLELLAATETVIVKNRRWSAALPFGVGQFQNGKDEIGWVLLSSEVVLGGAALVSTVAFVNLQTDGVNALNSQANSTDRVILGGNVNRELKTWHSVATVTAYGFAATAIFGIIEAQINFVPEIRTTRRRELPQSVRRPTPERPASVSQFKLQLSPRVLATERELFLGLGGTFW